MTKLFKYLCVLVVSLFLFTGILPVKAEETPVNNILNEAIVEVKEEDGTQSSYLKADADPASLKESDISDWYFKDVAENKDLSYAVLVFNDKTDTGIFVKDGKFYTGKTLLDGISLKKKEDGSYEVPGNQPSFEVNEDTGEVSFFDDVAIGEDLLEFDGDFTDADIISSLSSAAQEEGKNEDAAANAANAPEEKKHDDNRTAEEKPRFNSVKKKSSASKVNASQKEADEWMSSKSDFIQPPKSKKTKEN